MKNKGTVGWTTELDQLSSSIDWGEIYRRNSTAASQRDRRGNLQENHGFMGSDYSGNRCVQTGVALPTARPTTEDPFIVCLFVILSSIAYQLGMVHPGMLQDASAIDRFRFSLGALLINQYNMIEGLTDAVNVPWSPLICNHGDRLNAPEVPLSDVVVASKYMACISYDFPDAPAMIVRLSCIATQ